MEELILAVILLCSTWYPSALSGLYIIVGIINFIQIYNRPMGGIRTYQLLIILSLFNLFWKLALAIVISTACCAELIQPYENIFKLLGYFEINPIFNWHNSFKTYAPDCLAFLIGICGLILISRKLTGNRIKQAGIWKYFAIFSLFAVSLSMCSYVNLVYAVVGLVLSLHWGYEGQTRIATPLYKLVAIVSFLQLISGYVVLILFQPLINNHLFPAYMTSQDKYNALMYLYNTLKTVGVYITLDTDSFTFISILCVFTFSLIYVRLGCEYIASSDLLGRIHPLAHRRSSLKAPLLESSRDSAGSSDSSEESNDSNVLNESDNFDCWQFIKDRISFSVIFVIARYLLFLWVFEFQSFESIPLMIWLFYSILQEDSIQVMKSIKYTLLPYSIAYFLSFYVSGILDNEMKYMSYFSTSIKRYQAGLILQALTILCFCLLKRRSNPYRLARSGWDKVKRSGFTIAIMVQNFDKLSLCVVFGVGLSVINLLHTGFMVFCLIFMLRTNLSKKFWSWLVVYTMFVIFLRYVWYLSIDLLRLYLPAYMIQDTQKDLYNLIGLPSLDKNPADRGDEDWDLIIWLLILVESLQLTAYRSSLFEMTRTELEVVDDERSNKLFISFMVKIYKLCLIYQTWIVYCSIYLLITITPQNILNFIRFLLLMTYLATHVLNKENTLDYGMNQVKKFWFLIEYYSGILMVLRYVYQFINFTTYSQHSDWLKFVGIEVYDKTVLYAYMITDCSILILAVITSRVFSTSRLFGDNYVLQPTLVLGDDRNMGLLTGLMKIELETATQIKDWPKVFMWISPIFNIVTFISVFLVAIFWKLSGSMLILIIFLGYHLIRYGFSFCVKLNNQDIEDKAQEWDRRYSYWKISIIFIILYNIIEYAIFAFDPASYQEPTPELPLPEPYSLDILRVLYQLGFEVTRNGPLLQKILGYGVLLFIFIIERQCLEYLKSERATLRYVPTGIPKKVLGFFRVMFEAFIPACILWVAFSKLTIFTILYVLFVFFGVAFARPIPRLNFFNIVIVICLIVQYMLILSNFSNAIVPNYGGDPQDKSTFQPWYKHILWYTPDDPQFFAMGTSLSQLVTLVYDFTLLISAHIYYRFLLLSAVNEKGDSNDEQSIKREAKKSKSFWAKFVMKARKIIYSISHLLLMSIVLLLISQNTGVISLIYCLFCLLFIYRSNDFLNKMEDWDSFLKVLRNYFILYIIIDLILQSLYQMPMQNLQLERGNAWASVLGLLSLWRAGEGNEPEDAAENYTKVNLKIMTFAILYLMYRAMTGKDFKDYRQTLEAKQKGKRATIGLEMAQYFNDDRISRNQGFIEKIKQHRKELERLDNMVAVHREELKRLDSKITDKEEPERIEIDSSDAKIYKKDTQQEEQKEELQKSDSKELDQRNKLLSVPDYKLRRSNRSFTSGSMKYTAHTFNQPRKAPKLPMTAMTMVGSIALPKESNTQALVRQAIIENKNTFLGWFQKFLIDNLNPVLFKRVIQNLRERIQNQELIYREAESEEQPESNQEKKDFMKLDLTWREYFDLITYFFISNSDALVYFFFFLNHFMYGSVESIIFPLSVLGYAILENPRPSPKYWRIMLFYSQLVFFVKFSLQLPFWDLLFDEPCFNNFQDPYKLGFNCASNTYSGDLFNYILYDVLVMLTIILHEYYLINIGLSPYVEYELESLHEAKIRSSYIKFTIHQHSSQEQTYKKSYDKVRRERYSFDEQYDSNSISLYARFKTFWMRLLPYEKEEKPGKDMYFYVVICQFLILIYIFCFYTKMNKESQDIATSFRANSFSGSMVIAILIQIFIMMFDRYLYVERTTIDVIHVQNFTRSGSTNTEDINTRAVKSEKAVVVKLLLHYILLIGVHLLVFWYYPLKGNFDKNNNNLYCDDLLDHATCNNFQINRSLQMFYILFLIYFIYAGIQQREGLPKFRKGSFKIMHKYTYTNRVAFQIYRGMPFLFELRTLLDWSFTKTSLDIWQWLKFEDIYAALYLTKCKQLYYYSREKGEAVTKINKFCIGICGLFVLLLIMLLPLLIFSSLNPIVEKNPVKGMGLDVGIRVGDENYYKLYQASRTLNITNIDDSTWNKYELKDIPGLQTQDKALIQVVSLPKYSDNIWDISPPSKDDLCKRLKEDAIGSDHKVSIWLEYTIKRNKPAEMQKVQNEIIWDLEEDYITRLYNVICVSSASNAFAMPNYNRMFIRISSAGDHLLPSHRNLTAVTRNFMMFNNITKSNSYWAIGASENVTSEYPDAWNNLKFIVLSDNYSPATFNFSVVTFYVTVVYFAGKMLRTLTSGNAHNIILTEMRDPAPLINLCEGIYVSRMTGDIEKEEELYYDLIDILRSPEIVKIVTGSSSISWVKPKTE